MNEVFLHIASGSMRVRVETTSSSVRLEIVDKYGSGVACMLSGPDAVRVGVALRAAGSLERP